MQKKESAFLSCMNDKIASIPSCYIFTCISVLFFYKNRGVFRFEYFLHCPFSPSYVCFCKLSVLQMIENSSLFWAQPSLKMWTLLITSSTCLSWSWLFILQVSTSYAPDFSVLMPGQQYPTYLAQPAPLPSCSREGICWPSHEHKLVLP